MLNHLENDGALTKLSLSTRLRKAVEQEEWTLHYQPLIDLFTGEMFGVEALIRWPDPAGGLVPPGDFIPLAEEMGLIEAIGAWVVEEICRQDAMWRDEGLELEIGFNLSPRQLWQPDPVGRIADQIEGAGIDPQRITVEITESTAMHDPDRTLGVLHGFKDHGLKLAIDDFGTGLLLAVAAAVHAGRRLEDRPHVRARRERDAPEREHGLGDHRARLEPADGTARRRDRDRGGVAVPRGTGLPRRTRLPVLEPGACRAEIPAMHRRRRA